MSNHAVVEVQDLSNELVVLSARLVRVVRRNTTDVPAASTRLLSLLDELGPSAVGALAEADRCSQPTMTGLVKGLVEKGWAARSPHPDDARSSLVALTPAGLEQLAHVRERNAALVAERIRDADLSPQDLATTVAVLRDLVG
ncbi:DNA-binding transcriptional regulator, MarR family [Nocardioides scoriae]|uniref:DNA-binding transcriptional regulator, MarR family n=1 Tax=Nocardioides scoriae TaxID=642780 RepID=A0A1H1LCQ2_9ACTN|nr:MarR family transcriptional regulator [Nocardioides scoriae]SDR72276.1 DNA-binding transcriptional regulator, MarR family [Nocardioides scoriae]